MTRSAAVQQRQAHWRALLSRQAHSGLSAAAFCKSEGIPAPTFYWWRAQLRAGQEEQAPFSREEPPAAPFIDLSDLAAPGSALREEQTGFDVRLALPGGIVLTIARR
jgi:hypothetical protein